MFDLLLSQAGPQTADLTLLPGPNLAAPGDAVDAARLHHTGRSCAADMNKNLGETAQQNNANVKAVIAAAEACSACHANGSGSSGTRQAAPEAYRSSVLDAHGISALKYLAKTIGVQLASGPEAPKSAAERELIRNQVLPAAPKSAGLHADALPPLHA